MDEGQQMGTDTPIGFGEDTTLDKDKLKHDKTAYVKRTARDQMFTGTEVKKRGRGRPRKNPLPCFSPPPPASPFDHTMTDRPAKRKKGEGQDYTGLHSFKMMVQQEKRQRRCKRNEDIFSPFQDSPESANIHLEDHSAPTSGKKYEWAGLYSDIYKSEIPKSLSSPAHTDSLEYDPEKHEYGLLPAPIHVGKYLRLKRIDFQLPYEIYQLSAQKKSLFIESNILDGPDQEKSQTEVTSSKAHDCVSGTASRIDVNQQTAASLETVEEITESDVCNTVLSQSAPPKQQSYMRKFENLSDSPDRSFVLEHCVFLVRNYEKMRDRQALLLGDEAMERETENGEDEGSGHKQPGDVEGASTKSDQNQSHLNSQSERREGCEESRSVPCKNLLQTLQGIYDVIVSHKGASGQTLAAPLLNLRSRKRSGSAPVDLTMLQMQLLSGLYQSLDSFHSDMLKVFHCAEKYYGCDSSVGRNVRQLRDIYYDAHQEALTQLSSFL
ncbi:hypothetical protein DNTS_017876 [Danionella cerebrum]|uniref:Bromo domain-containing protein n=1 Tax=Danionella cerebrum TaxID=2873325 RepID=A0A553N226_9TELE|nr:hypothetical protein DNTS_017876 [Danionella translucida]